MKKVVFLLLCFALTLSAADRVVESGSITSPSIKGTYTVVSSFDPDLPSSAYGMAIQDDATDRLWIASWGDLYTYEFDMSTGFPTGNTWEITNSIDGDDMAWCEYSGGAQFFIGDFQYFIHRQSAPAAAERYGYIHDTPAALQVEICGMRRYDYQLRPLLRVSCPFPAKRYEEHK